MAEFIPLRDIFRSYFTIGVDTLWSTQWADVNLTKMCLQDRRIVGFWCDEDKVTPVIPGASNIPKVKRKERPVG